MTTDLAKDFPSLKLWYEQIKDTLSEQRTVASGYVNRAVTLFSVATAIIGIGLPVLFTKNVANYYLVHPAIPLYALSAIPVFLYASVVVHARRIWTQASLSTLSNPIGYRDQFIVLQPENFYSDMIQHIEKAFAKNDAILTELARSLVSVYWLLVAEAVVVIFSVIGFAALA